MLKIKKKPLKHFLLFYILLAGGADTIHKVVVVIEAKAAIFGLTNQLSKVQ